MRVFLMFLLICATTFALKAQLKTGNESVFWEFSRFSVISNTAGEFYRIDHGTAKLAPLDKLAGTFDLVTGTKSLYKPIKPLLKQQKILVEKMSKVPFKKEDTYFVYDPVSKQLEPLLPDGLIKTTMERSKEGWTMDMTLDDSVAVFRAYRDHNRLYCLKWLTNEVTVIDLKPADSLELNYAFVRDINWQTGEILFQSIWGTETTFFSYIPGQSTVKDRSDLGNSYYQADQYYMHSFSYNSARKEVIKRVKIKDLSMKVFPINVPGFTETNVGWDQAFTSANGKKQFMLLGCTMGVYMWNDATGKFEKLAAIDNNLIAGSATSSNQLIWVTDGGDLVTFDVTTKKILSKKKLVLDLQAGQLTASESAELYRIRNNCAHELNIQPDVKLNMTAAKYDENGRWLVSLPEGMKQFYNVEVHYGDLNFDGYQDMAIENTLADKRNRVTIVFGAAGEKYSGQMSLAFPDDVYDVAIENQQLLVTIRSGKSEVESRIWKHSYNHEKKAFEVVEVVKGIKNKERLQCQYLRTGSRIDTVFIALEPEKKIPGLDLDRDGRDDKVQSHLIKMGTEKEGTFSLYRPDDVWGVKVNLSSPAKELIYTLPDQASNHETGDFDGDGWTDFAFVSQRFKGIEVFFNDGKKGTFTQKHIPLDFTIHNHFQAFDFDGDHRVELAVKNDGKIRIFGSDQARNLKEESVVSGVQFSAYVYDAYYDLNLDGFMDYVSIELVKKSEQLYMQFANYYGQVSASGYSLKGFKDVFSDRDLYKVYMDSVNKAWEARDQARRARDKAAREAMHSVHDHQHNEDQKVYCDMCSGSGTVFQNGSVKCDFCSGSGGQSSACSWCQGTGTMVTYYYDNYGKKQSNGRSCPKCAGGMAGGGVGCYACGGKGTIQKSGYFTCPQCAGLKYYYLDKNGEPYR